MKLLISPKPTLQELNEYCLLRIFEELNINEQFILLELHQNFKNAMLYLWQRKFSKVLNFDKIEHFKLLPTASSQQKLFHLLLHTTTELQIFNQQHLKTLRTLLEKNIYTRIESISLQSCNNTSTELCQSDTYENFHAAFPELRNLKLQHLPINIKNIAACRNLNTLELLHCTLQDNAQDFDAIFQQLHLTKFVFLPHNIKVSKNAHQLAAIHNCTSLNVLKLHALDLWCAIDAVSQLPQLQQLTVFTNTPKHQNHNNESININSCVDRIVRCLKISKATQITALRLKFQFTRSLLQHFCLQQLPNLEEFAWHSHLQVDRRKNVVEWQACDAQVSGEVLNFIKSCGSLRHLDLRNNAHVTHKFMDQLLEIVQHRFKTQGIGMKIDWDPQKHIVLDFYSGTKGLNEVGYLEFKFKQ